MWSQYSGIFAVTYVPTFFGHHILFFLMLWSWSDPAINRAILFYSVLSCIILSCSILFYLYDCNHSHLRRLQKAGLRSKTIAQPKPKSRLRSRILKIKLKTKNKAKLKVKLKMSFLSIYFLFFYPNFFFLNNHEIFVNFRNKYMWLNGFQYYLLILQSDL